jgi:hypothetical protein
MRDPAYHIYKHATVVTTSAVVDDSGDAWLLTIQCGACELPRILIPRTPVNRS